MKKWNGPKAQPTKSATKRTRGASRPVLILNMDRMDGYFVGDAPVRKPESGHGAAADAGFELAGLGA